MKICRPFLDRRFLWPINAFDRIKQPARSIKSSCRKKLDSLQSEKIGNSTESHVHSILHLERRARTNLAPAGHRVNQGQENNYGIAAGVAVIFTGT